MSDITGSGRSAARGFVATSQVLSAEDVSRGLRRVSHEILERHGADADLAVIGLQTGGVAVADALVEEMRALGLAHVARGRLDVAYWRDDLHARPLRDASSTEIPGDLTNRVVILVDDVLYTGRTIRAALNALSEWGRPQVIELAVLVDRGHRELPIRPDYVGKNLPTAAHEAVLANLDGVWIGEEVES